jgi:hypothetical protein
MHMLKSTNVALGDVRDTEARLRALHPTENVHTSADRRGPGVQPDAETFHFITGKWLDKQISKSKAGSATDQWGWDGREMWAAPRKDKELLHQIAVLLFRPIAAGYLPAAYREHLAGGRLVALTGCPVQIPKGGDPTYQQRR